MNKYLHILIKALNFSGDFLESYCEEDDMGNVARLLVAVFMVVLYPLECHGAREVELAF